jgi:hypothetical protein
MRSIFINNFMRTHMFEDASLKLVEMTSCIYHRASYNCVVFSNLKLFRTPQITHFVYEIKQIVQITEMFTKLDEI